MTLLQWLVCVLLLALCAASWALASAYDLNLALLDLYVQVHPSTALRQQRPRARGLRDTFRLMTACCALGTVVWAGVAAHLL